MTKHQTLTAVDTDDLQIISAQLQDAVTRAGDLVWLPKSRRFAALFNRFRWENGKVEGERVRSGLHFDSVLTVKSFKFRRDDPKAVASLLTIAFKPRGNEDPGGTIEMVFSGGGMIRLEVESIEAGLSDISGPWAARGRPVHELGD